MKAEVTIFGLEEMNERVRKLEQAMAGLIKQPPEQDWHDIHSAAAYLGVSTRSVRRLLNRSLLKRSLGIRRILIHREDLEAYRSKVTI